MRYRSPDGQCLILSSRDGYCTLIIFDEILPAYQTQQHTLQLQSIAHQHSVPLSYSTSNTSTYHSASAGGTPLATPSSANINLPFVITPIVPKKRNEPPLTPAASIDGDLSSFSGVSSSALFPFPTLGKESLSQSESGDGEAEQPNEGEGENIQEPPKKKRRVALTRVGDLDS